MSAYNLTNEVQIRNFTQVDVKIDPEYGIVWVYQKPRPRPCFNTTLVEELRSIQLMLEVNKGELPYNGKNIPIHYFVLDSLTPGIFSTGGDLNLFRHCIANKDKDRLLKYAKSCINTIHGFIVGCRMPITTISLVRGDALGGGFEAALSCQVVITEKDIGMGFPEVLFNLFPGMGSYHLLSQRIPQKQIERIMLSGRKYPVEELYDMGIVDKLVERGEGRQAVYSYIKDSNKYRNTHLAMKHIREKVYGISHDELIETCNYWVDTAMNLSERDLKLMDRLIKAQDKKVAAEQEDVYQRSIA